MSMRCGWPPHGSKAQTCGKPASIAYVVGTYELPLMEPYLETRMALALCGEHDPLCRLAPLPADDPAEPATQAPGRSAADRGAA